MRLGRSDHTKRNPLILKFTFFVTREYSLYIPNILFFLYWGAGPTQTLKLTFVVKPFIWTWDPFMALNYSIK